MWIVMGDEWYERAFNRRKYNEAHSEQGFARHEAPEVCSRSAKTCCTANV